MIQHVTSVQRMVSQLKDVGLEITEVDLMAKILRSLPQKFSTLATAWNSVPLAEQTVGLLLERLIKEEKKMSVKDGASNAFVMI